MPDLQLVIDLVIAVVAAFIGGVIAQRLGQPVIVGYLAAGVVIGPFTPGPQADIRSVSLLAEIGVAFLMFAVGTQFSTAELRRIGRVATIGGPLQVLLTIPLGPLVAIPLGLSFAEGLFLGALIAISSTVVAGKVLVERGELQALHGRVAVGFSIVQDLAFIPMVVLLPLLGALGGEPSGADLGVTLVTAVAFVGGVYAVGRRAMPWILTRVAVPRSRELFLLAVVAMALGTALFARSVGLSVAFGAFMAGLAIAETEQGTQVLAEVVPFRDLFASLFFVSVGMLVDPALVLSALGLLGLLLAVTVLGKLVIVASLVLMLGTPARVAILAGLTLAQIGEYSFVLGRVGVDSRAISAELFDLVLAAAVVSIFLSPLLLRTAPWLVAGLQRFPIIGAALADPVEPSEGAGLQRHTVICGFGRMGRELAEALAARGLRYLVVEYNPEVTKALRAAGVPVVYGDAGNPAVLDHASLETATLLAVLVPDAAAAERATRHARSLHPRLDIVARAMNAQHVERLRAAGATDVVQPEFEAGVEVIRHALRRYGISGMELQSIAAGRRASFYRRAESTEGVKE